MYSLGKLHIPQLQQHRVLLGSQRRLWDPASTVIVLGDEERHQVCLQDTPYVMPRSEQNQQRRLTSYQDFITMLS